MSAQGRRIEVRGIVQGVGFRPWVYRLAREEGIGGRVSNGTEGVTIEAFGLDAALDAFLDRLRSSPSARLAHSRARVDADPRGAGDGLRHRREPRRGKAPRLDPGRPRHLPGLPGASSSIPTDRRYRYPFTNCTNCGPRFTIARGVPYDRPATTMASFRMCADCQREYDSPLDRRFHAQPNACPACGPRLIALDADGRRLDADPIRAAAEVLRAGGIVALKGIGGFHLACDATSPAAVALLRRRKRRDEKPFAVMVRDLDSGRAASPFSTELDRELLASIERPIVLVPRRGRSRLAPGIAPAQSPRRAPAALLAAPPPAPRRRGAAARHDLRQPFRGADRIPRRRRPRETRGHRRSLPACTTARSSRAATIRWPASSPGAPSSSGAPGATCPAAFPCGGRSSARCSPAGAT